MTETYGMPVQVGARPIVAPIGAGEARIPALVRLPGERLLLFYDERPAPASGTGAGLRVKMCVWLGVSRGLDLAFLNAD